MKFLYKGKNGKSEVEKKHGVRREIFKKIQFRIRAFNKGPCCVPQKKVQLDPMLSFMPK
jgi:hypothetical protein